LNYAYNPNPGGNPLQPPVGGNKNKTGPSWFQKMDTNGDGYVSEREFLGTSAQFQKFDTNDDLLIDAQEAQRITEVNPKKGD
jgi:hypothetical protein